MEETVLGVFGTRVYGRDPDNRKIKRNKKKEGL
jgi:hypothetical protein